MIHTLLITLIFIAAGIAPKIPSEPKRVGFAHEVSIATKWWAIQDTSYSLTVIHRKGQVRIFAEDSAIALVDNRDTMFSTLGNYMYTTVSDTYTVPASAVYARVPQSFLIRPSERERSSDTITATGSLRASCRMSIFNRTSVVIGASAEPNPALFAYGVKPSQRLLDDSVTADVSIDLRPLRNRTISIRTFTMIGYGGPVGTRCRQRMWGD